MSYNIDPLKMASVVGQVIDLAVNPDDYRVSRQSQVEVGGVFFPRLNDDARILRTLMDEYERTLQTGVWQDGQFSAVMLKAILRSRARTKTIPDRVDYISIDPQDYGLSTAEGIHMPIIKIHTRPEPVYGLGVLRFAGGALGLSLGRMRVYRPKTIMGKTVFPVTIRTKWRAQTNQTLIKELKDTQDDCLGAVSLLK